LSRTIDQFINQIICGDAQQVLQKLPDESIDCVVTSPPYWALRDYGVKGQLGLEPRFQDFIVKLCNVFDEVKRVLKRSGTCWVNIGDTYYSNHGAVNSSLYRSEVVAQARSIRRNLSNRELPSKSLCQIPSRFAIEMANRGWILRNEIIWFKKNCMPASVRDRFTVDFEKVLFFVKGKKYWFDPDAVREPHSQANMAETIKRARKLGYSGKRSYKDWYFHERKKTSWVGVNNSKIGLGAAARGMPKTKLLHPLGRAKRCVWAVGTVPFHENHFATYPPKLIETPILAGCPQGGIVLDPFMGSGTTALVAQNLGRNFVGIDLNPAYIKMAQLRLAKQPLPLVFYHVS
jgi:DNA modification methylase